MVMGVEGEAVAASIMNGVMKDVEVRYQANEIWGVMMNCPKIRRVVEAKMTEQESARLKLVEKEARLKRKKKAEEAWRIRMTDWIWQMGAEIFQDERDTLADLLAGWKWLGSGSQEDMMVDDDQGVGDVGSYDDDDRATVVVGGYKPFEDMHGLENVACSTPVKKQTNRNKNTRTLRKLLVRGRKGEDKFDNNKDRFGLGTMKFGGSEDIDMDIVVDQTGDLGHMGVVCNGGNEIELGKCAEIWIKSKNCGNTNVMIDKDSRTDEQASQDMEVSQEVMEGMQLIQEMDKTDSIIAYDKDNQNEVGYWANVNFITGGALCNNSVEDKEDTQQPARNKQNMVPVAKKKDAQEQAMDKQIKVQVAQKTYNQEEDTIAAQGKSNFDTNLTSIIVGGTEGGRVPGYGQAVHDDQGGQEGVGVVHDDLQ
jgi:hypothetical protein